MVAGFHRKWGVVCAVVLWGSAVLADVEYSARITGADRGLRLAVKESILTFKLKKRPPATMGQLRRRIDRDLPRIKTILESRGYYDAEVAVAIDTNREPLRVTFALEPGEPYRFRNLELHFEGAGDPAFEKISRTIHKGDRAVAARVFEEQQFILKAIQQAGYPFPTLGRRRVWGYHESKAVDLELIFDPGIQAVYGDIKVEGLESVKPKYIHRQLPWKLGDPFDAKQLEDFERKLLGVGLFGTVHMEPVRPAGGTNAVPVKITVTERDKRTVRLGVGYSDVGPSVKIQWEHRNLMGGGEHLETAALWSPIEVGGRATLSRPGFLGSKQTLVLALEMSRETPDAFDAKRARTSAMVLHDFTEELQVGSGVGYKYSKVDQLNSSERYGHVFFPLQGLLDYRDDRLNPVRGGVLFGRTAYFLGMQDSDSFLKSGAEGRLYHLWWKRYRLSSALRLTLGSIDGASVENIPADERLYAGGGGSVRGYEYQAIGPTLNGVPLGGDKLLEFSLEMRLQPGRKLGYVAFVDGGTVYNDWGGAADRSLNYGAGLGLRYFTGIGPLRVDLAYPLNPTESQVKRLQFYISLGQAF
jgi:translocation and assembly module TamA